MSKRPLRTARPRRAFGYRVDPEDHRDHPLAVSHLSAADLPESADLRELLPRGAELDQGPLGSCVANALSYAFVMQCTRTGTRNDPISRLFVYWHARNQHNDTQSDTGTYIREAVKVSNALGRVAERLYPYVVNDLDTPRPRFTRKPGPQVLVAAHDTRIAQYQRIPADAVGRKLGIMSALSQQSSVVLGTDVSWTFVGYDLQTQGEMKTFGPPTGGIAGGHAMCAVGYDELGVIIVNSWRDWGFNGFARLSWDYVLADCTRDIWSIRIP